MRITFLALCATLLYVANARSQENYSLGSVQQLAKLNQALKDYDYDPESSYRDRGSRYVVAFRDLNDDGALEAIVYLIDSDHCGSGGCNTLILEQEENVWKIKSSINITRPPIRVLSKKCHGWHSISVFVAGGGIIPGYETELDFNGKEYPANPTMPPAKPLKNSAGEVVIKSIQGAIPLD